MRKGPEGGPFLCNLDLLIMLGRLLLDLPGCLAFVRVGVAGLPIRWELELGRLPTGCTSRYCSLPVIAPAAIITATIIAAAIISLAIISTAICTPLNSTVDFMPRRFPAPWTVEATDSG